MDKQKGNLLRGHLDMLVLATVARAPAHGYEVLRRLEQDGCGLFHFKEGTVYPVLYRNMTDWEIDGIQLNSGENELVLFGFDLGGNFVESDTITITSTFVTGPPPVIASIDPSSAYPTGAW